MCSNLKPLVLSRSVGVVGVGAKHEDMDAGHFEGVVEVGRGSALEVWHFPPRVVGFEAFLDERDDLLVVVSLRHHPGFVIRIR